jgi:hypothetical protein
MVFLKLNKVFKIRQNNRLFLKARTVQVQFKFEFIRYFSIFGSGF